MYAFYASIHCKKKFGGNYWWKMVVANSTPTLVETSHLSGFLPPTPVGLDLLIMDDYYTTYGYKSM